MNLVELAKVIFTGDKGTIIIQDRTGHSKIGEKLGFFGGGIKQDETPEQALRRELLEELRYSPEILNFFIKQNTICKITGKFYGWKVIEHIFLSPITPELLGSPCLEGGGIKELQMHSNFRIFGKGTIKS